MKQPKPILKWAGGKRTLLNDIKSLMPKTYKNYYEPFVGGASVLFEVRPKKAIINDFNSELINVLRCVKDDKKLESLIKELKMHQNNHSEEYYYEIRNLDRNKKSFLHLADYKRAARTIYLNKACFNGLYRVNKNNEFNVPYGKKESVVIYSEINLALVHVYLNQNDVEILNGDFERALKNAKKGDFIYLDPPYDSDTISFTDYTENGFGKEEQKRLAKVFKELDKKGCYVMLSNYNTKLIKELYDGYNFNYVETQRNIGAQAANRGKVEEVIVTNYTNERGE